MIVSSDGLFLALGSHDTNLYVYKVEEDGEIYRKYRQGILKVNQHTNAAVHRQNTLTLISEIVEESDFSETAYNATSVSDVQSMIAKNYFATTFQLNFLDTR